MKIVDISYKTPNTNVKQPNFTGNLYEELTRVIPNTKVAKNLTQLDVRAMHYYAQARMYRLGITSEEVAKISKLDGKDFCTAAFDLLTKKLGIPTDVRPQLKFIKIHDKDSLACFAPITNMLLIDLDKMNGLNLDNAEVFSAIRHEMQHFLQFKDMLRHREYGEKITDFLLIKYKEGQKVFFENLLDNCPEEAWAQVLHGNPRDLTVLKYMQMFRQIDLESEIDKMFDAMSSGYRHHLEAFRSDIIKKFGEINKYSNLTPKIKNDYQEFVAGYKDKAGNIDKKRYVQAAIEREAYIAQTQAKYEYLQEPCFMKWFKEDHLKLIKESSKT